MALDLVDALAPTGRGAVWSATSDDLNVNVVAWSEGEGVGRHRNDERDVLLVVLSGAGKVIVGAASHPVAAGTVLLIPAGAEREVRAGPEGIRYVTAHVRRAPGVPLA